LIEPLRLAVVGLKGIGGTHLRLETRRPGGLAPGAWRRPGAGQGGTDGLLLP
jgi:hypothetical protein